MNKKFIQSKQGSALLMSILILASTIAVAFSISRLVLSSIENSGVQAQSVIAYYAAESGAERILWDLRKDYYVVESENSNFYSGDNTMSNGSSYQVYLGQWSPLKVISIGDFQDTKRSVELTF